MQDPNTVLSITAGLGNLNVRADGGREWQGLGDGAIPWCPCWSFLAAAASHCAQRPAGME